MSAALAAGCALLAPFLLAVLGALGCSPAPAPPQACPPPAVAASDAAALLCDPGEAWEPCLARLRLTRASPTPTSVPPTAPAGGDASWLGAIVDVLKSAAQLAPAIIDAVRGP